MAEEKKGFFKEFKEFISKGNIIDMAVGVVIGGAFGKIVTSLVNDIVMPPIGMAIGGVDFANLKATIQQAQLDEAGEVIKEAVTINYGNFIQTILEFIIIALCIFLVLKGIMKAKALAEKTLGYAWTSSRSGSDGLLFEKKSMGRMSVKCSIHTVPNQDFYCVENCDALKTLSSTDKVLLRYSNKLPAAVLHHGDGYRSASFGFPLECIQDQDALRGLMEETMNLLTDK